MNKFDVNKDKLEIGDIVVLCDCAESISREFEFWEVYADGIASLVFVKGLTSRKTDSFDCKCLKKVDKKYKELIDKATPKKLIDKEYYFKFGEYEFNHTNGVCPNCGNGIEYHDYDELNNCPKCGQAIDWSDENVE